VAGFPQALTGSHRVWLWLYFFKNAEATIRHGIQKSVARRRKKDALFSSVAAYCGFADFR